MAQNVRTVFDTANSAGLNVPDPREAERAQRAQTFLAAEAQRIQQQQFAQELAARMAQLAQQDRQFQAGMNFQREGRNLGVEEANAQRQQQANMAQFWAQANQPRQTTAGGGLPQMQAPAQSGQIGPGVFMGGAGIDFPRQSPETFAAERAPFQENREDVQAHELQALMAQIGGDPKTQQANLEQQAAVDQQVSAEIAAIPGLQEAFNTGHMDVETAKKVARVFDALPDGPVKDAFVKRIEAMVPEIHDSMVHRAPLILKPFAWLGENMPFVGVGPREIPTSESDIWGRLSPQAAPSEQDEPSDVGKVSFKPLPGQAPRPQRDEPSDLGPTGIRFSPAPGPAPQGPPAPQQQDALLRFMEQMGMTPQGVSPFEQALRRLLGGF